VYSSAWAFDEDMLEQLMTESAGLNTAYGDISDDLEESEANCNHYCHMSSHLVAIFYDSDCTAVDCITVYLSSLTEGSHSFIPGPERKPPRL
jgi:hypothetical protein